MSVARVVHSSRTIESKGRGLIDISALVRDFIRQEKCEQGLCHVFVRHTSASLLITENADPDVHRDLEAVFSELAPDGDPRYRHCDEGADDMAAHLRCALTQSTLTLPVVSGVLMLGTWQGLYLWEHRYQSHRRELIFSLQGDFSTADVDDR